MSDPYGPLLDENGEFILDESGKPIINEAGSASATIFESVIIDKAD